MSPLFFSLISLCFFFTSCATVSQETSSTVTQEIQGRDNGQPSFQRALIYRVKVPNTWERVDPKRIDSLFDTTKSLCDFVINDGMDQIKIAIHNFPSEVMAERIPPMAQVQRWKKQFTLLETKGQSLKPQAFAGFSGFLFFGSGLLQGKKITMLAWIMQIAPEHYQMLSLQKNDENLDAEIRAQMRADFTIKVLGPKNFVEKNLAAIQQFAHSFELIKEIPSRQ